MTDQTPTPCTEDRLQKLERENAQLRAALAELVRLLDAEDSPFDRPQTLAVAEAWIAARALAAQ